MRNTTAYSKFPASKPSVPLFAAVLALALVLSACGSTGGEVDAGAAGEDESSQQDAPTGASEEDSETGDDADSGDAGEPADGEASGDYQVTSASPDLISPQATAIDEIRRIDDQTIGIRYQNGSEPCALANVTVTETDADIEVALETGLHPNAAAMSCIAQVLGYEIQVTLDAPIAERPVFASDI